MSILPAILLISQLSRAAVFSETVGVVGDDVLTSRQVMLSALFEKQLGAPKEEAPAEPATSGAKGKGSGKNGASGKKGSTGSSGSAGNSGSAVKDVFLPSDVQGEFARREKSTLLLEAAVAHEAETFSIKAGEEESKALAQKAERYMNGYSEWARLDFSNEELQREAMRKLTAKSFIRMRTEAMQGVISDVEAQAYFDKNRVKFGQLPFASFKDNIKNFLAKQQLEQRLRSWFEIVRRKHRVREIRLESEGPRHPASVKPETSIDG